MGGGRKRGCNEQLGGKEGLGGEDTCQEARLTAELKIGTNIASRAVEDGIIDSSKKIRLI